MPKNGTRYGKAMGKKQKQIKIRCLNCGRKYPYEKHPKVCDCGHQYAEFRKGK